MVLKLWITEPDMARNLDLTALRSFAMVAEAGGVTRAAARLHLTQSAVSMQLKRLEESLGQPLLDRSGRAPALTSQGELLLSYARRMIQLNDEAWGRLTGQAFEGEVTLGVPSDIVYPHIPGVLQRFARDYPRVKVTLVSSYTRRLHAMRDRGQADLILTTEDDPRPGGETLEEARLVWVGAPGGQAWRARPLRLAFEKASVSADLAVHAALESAVAPRLEVIRHGGALPELPLKRINLYQAEGPDHPLTARLADYVREAYGVAEAPRLAAE
jgi:DNA-binding transcriptional LysR family regulator